MKLVASMLACEAEVDRYLIPCVASLLEFCDEVRLLMEGPWVKDERLMAAWGTDGRRVIAKDDRGPRFFEHEGQTRQRLLDFTLTAYPTHILAIDADEFVADGAALRRALENDDGMAAWTLCMEEVWNATDAGLELRQDGGWEEHDVAVVWRPDRLPKPLMMLDRPLACGRVPQDVQRAPRGCVGTALLHFGWANRPERAARHERYVRADGGRFHAGSHLDSIMLPDSSIELAGRPWPLWAPERKAAVLAYASKND